jgi:hypothetical protein
MAVTISVFYSQWHHGLAVDLVEDLRQPGIYSREAAEYALNTRESLDSGIFGDIAQRQKEEQDCQCPEYNLQGAVETESPDKHDSGEDPPDCQISGHREIIGGGPPTDLRENQQRYQAHPEQAVRCESRGAERISLFPFHAAGDYLRQPAEKEAHAEYHGIEREEAGVMQVKQYGGHAKSQQAKWRGIGGGIFDCGQSSRRFLHAYLDHQLSRCNKCQNHKSEGNLRSLRGL